MVPGLVWLGDQFRKRIIDPAIDKRMTNTGERVVARARELAPVRTGQLRDSIGYTYRQSDKTLSIHADAPHSFFVEFGTRFMLAHPFLRPALLEAGKAWGSSTELQFPEVVSSNKRPMPRASMMAVQYNSASHKGYREAFGKHQPRVVFFGKTAKSLTGYTPKYRSRFG